MPDYTYSQYPMALTVQWNYVVPWDELPSPCAEEVQARIRYAIGSVMWDTIRWGPQERPTEELTVLVDHHMATVDDDPNTPIDVTIATAIPIQESRNDFVGYLVVRAYDPDWGTPGQAVERDAYGRLIFMEM